MRYVWDGITRSSSLTAVAGEARQRLADQAWANDWDGVLAILTQLAVSGYDGPSRALHVAGVACVAWAVGLVVVFAPGGLGVREVVYIWLLAGLYPRAELEAAAVTTRLITVLAELAVFALDGNVATDKLFAKYPRPEGEDLDAAAKEYYDGNSFQRFRNHNLPQNRQPTPEDFFLPFENEDVKATAKREAPIYRSLQAWQSDMARRVEEGQTVDLAAEAAELGLTYH